MSASLFRLNRRTNTACSDRNKSCMADDLRVDGSATMYRLFDVGYSIALEAAAGLLGDSTRGRVRPARGEARAIEIRSPPLFASLGTFRVAAGTSMYEATLSAHLFEFGVCSLALRVDAPSNLTWSEFAAFGNAVDTSSDCTSLIDRELTELLLRIATAVERPRVSPILEEYTVFRVDRLESTSEADRGRPVVELLTDDRLIPLL